MGVWKALCAAVSRKMLCNFVYLSALLHHHIEHCQFSIYRMLLKLLTETALIFYIFIDMLMGAKKKSTVQLIDTLKVFQTTYKTFFCQYLDHVLCVHILLNAVALSVSLNFLSMQKELICWLKDWCRPVCFIEYSSENLRTCFYIIQANILLSPEEFLRVSMVLESNAECSVPGLVYLVHMLQEFWYLCSDT